MKNLLLIPSAVYDVLLGFAQSDGFWANWQTAFGTNYDPIKATELRQQWQSRDFSELPSIEVVSGEVLGTANGAYASSNNKIYLSESFLNTASPAAIVNVILEEIGHYVDAQINQTDSVGDEGAIFAALVQGEVLSPGVLAQLKTEDDGGWLEVNGQKLDVEYNNPTVSLSLTSPTTVTEDGTQNLFYTFTRSGDTTNSLTVNFNVSGTATFNSDYVQRGATSFGSSTGSITFAAGSSVAILTLDPNSDVVSDGNETVALTLAAGTGYTIGTTSTVTGSILDNDVTPGTVVRTPIAPTSHGNTRHEFRNYGAFAALKSDGSVVTWGISTTGGDSSSVASQLASGVTQISSSRSAFAALKSDGSVVTWGESSWGGDSSSVAGQLTNGVTQISSNGWGAFAALKSDGSVVTWGISTTGGNSSSVASQLASGVTQIFSTQYAFAALKNNGSVVTWGLYGGDSSSVASQLTGGVTQIFSTQYAFAALKNNGSVVTWGGSGWGGNYGENSSSVASQLASGVTQIFSNANAFAALKSNGSVVSWGSADHGGNSSSVAWQLTSGVTQISSAWGAFAALKSDGSVVTWGDSSYGGDSSSVASQLASGVTQIFSSGSAFAALKSDGSVVTWGNSSNGGNSSSVAGQLTSDVTRIFSTSGAFAALKSNGSVITWGDSSRGGNSSSVASQLTSGVSQIFSADEAFAALKSDGSVITWGNSSWGGNSSSVASQLGSGVVSFADPFNDDRLVPLSPTPTITLAVAPATVTEDGTSNLIYTFTRTGVTSNALTVNYTVGGTATIGTDYTGIATAGTTKIVTFAANSSIATVTVDPTTDNTVESNETVALTLASGTGYTIGTTNAVTGTIINDDFPTVSLSLTSPTRVTEDGSQNLFYTFTRTGDITNSLTVNFNVSGTATFNSDYVQRGATSFGTTTGSVTFAAGSSVAILTLDPNSDVVSDGNETVALTLAAGTGYSVGTTSAVTGTILDNDVSPGTVTRSPFASPGRTRHERRNSSAFAALKSDGSVVTWGDSSRGGNSSGVASQLSSGVTQIFSTAGAFAALKSDGSVVTWGDSSFGGDSSGVASQLSSGVTQIFSPGRAFAALKGDGSVITWGSSDWGGDSSGVASRLSGGVTQIFSTGSAFAALKSDGSVVTWGDSSRGGNSSGVSSQLSSGVTQIFSTGSAFAALKSDGSVVTWGDSSRGGNSSGVSSQLSSGVTQIFSNDSAFAALKSDGSVVTWGDSGWGGNSSGVASRLSSGVTQIFSTAFAFAALKSDGSVVTWGNSSFGGNSSGVSSHLTSGVNQIFSTSYAFAALKGDGSVVTWGDSSYGGNSSGVASRLSGGVTQIFSNGLAFAALKSDGSVVTWGDSSFGGNSSGVSSHLTSGVNQIFSTSYAFAALKSDGSVVTWGSYVSGGNSSSVASQLSSGVVSFADPFNDDRLVALSPTPTITLAVAPATVTEDGTSNLIYTFTRTGSTTNTLTVNYTIGGTATNGNDYSNIGTSVTFAAGSSTATVTVDPTADTTVESDETVALTLASGTGYTIGTTSAVTGTITNDDLPSVSLSLTSPTTVTEDGTQNLIYTFTRTGSITNTLTVNYTIGGTANNGNDYSSIGTSVTFAAGSSTATVTVDPTADTTVESDETVILTLASGTGYTIGTTSAVTGTITNSGTGYTIGTPTQTEQYASTVISFSSQWSVGSWGAVQILGQPNTLSYGDLPTSWAPRPANADGDLQADEFITVGFATPVYASGIEVRETYGNGFVRSIDLLSNQGTYYSVWSGIDTSKPGLPVDFRINFDQTSYLVVGARINVDIDHTSSWEEIDSVKLIGTTGAVTGTITNDDPFTGTSNADTLIGTTGADTLIGLAGNDTYTVNHVGDIVTEALNAGTDLVNGSISYTLPNNVENLTLTGSSNINGTGNNLNNTLTGNSGNNTLNGGAGIDTLTGGVGSDIFVFQFGQSPVSGADRITDFAIGTDRIDLLSSSGGVLAAPTSFTRAANSTATTLTNVVNSVFTDANGALTGNQALGVNSAALVNVTTSGIAGTYLVINDGVAGFQASNDLLVNITGFTGTLPALGSIVVSNFFI